MADFCRDQAAGLRQLFRQEGLRAITFAAGNKGAGKTQAVANVASVMARSGREVLILDESADGSLAALFGTKSRYDLYHVIRRERALGEVLLPVAPGVNLLPAARAVQKLGKLNRAEQETLIEALSSINDPIDVILVDSSTDHPLGFSPFGLAAQDTVVVAPANGEAITAAYALIKKVSLGYERRHFRLLVNKAKGAADAAAIHANVAELARQRGVAILDFAGHLPLDPALPQAARLGQPAVLLYPEAPAAKALRSLALDMLRWPSPASEAGGVEQFVLQLLHFSQHIDPVPIHAG